MQTPFGVRVCVCVCVCVCVGGGGGGGGGGGIMSEEGVNYLYKLGVYYHQ